MNYIIGPSHLTEKYISLITDPNMFSNCIIEGHKGLPIWSRHILKSINEHDILNNQIFWMVSDYKFNNFDYSHLVKSNDLFMDVIGYVGNISRDFMEKKHLYFLAKHSLKVIDFIIQHFPKIKLIFWCLYKRTKVNKNSSYPKFAWYDSIKERYKDNIIDFDLFTNPEEFSTFIIDESAHPNLQGLMLLDRMISSCKK